MSIPAPECRMLAHVVEHAESTRAARTHILCVDDSADMAYILRRLIEAEPEMECVGCVDSADALVEAMDAPGPRPDVVVLDATMPGREPMEAMADLAARYPTTRTIVFSGHGNEAFVERARAAGAWGCVCKDEDPLAIIRAVREVAAGRASWPGRAAHGEC